MNRRTFLFAALASCAPLFVAEAFAAEPSGPSTVDLTALTEAWQRARSAHRPLLVIVIPADARGEAYLRGESWGEVLMHGSDKLMALLGQVDVVCAHDAAVRAFAPDASGPADPWFWLISTASLPAAATPGTVTLPPPIDYSAETQEEYQAMRKAEESIVDARIRAMERALGSAIEAATGGVDALPASVREELAASAVATLRKGIPANGHWANQSGCGLYLEDVQPQWGIGCGMGHVPARSARVLFLGDLERWKREPF